MRSAKKNIQKVLNIGEVGATSFEEVQKALVEKIRQHKHQVKEEHERTLAAGRSMVYQYCEKYLLEREQNWKRNFGDDANVYLRKCAFDDTRVYAPTNTPYHDFFFKQIVKYAQKHDYFFNRYLPKAWFVFGFEFSEDKKYELGITIHHYGYDDLTLVIGAFLQTKVNNDEYSFDSMLPLVIPPHVISIYNGVSNRERNIRKYLEDAFTVAMAQIASEL